jgi:hypothetical protein
MAARRDSITDTRRSSGLDIQTDAPFALQLPRATIQVKQTQNITTCYGIKGTGSKQVDFYL